MPPEDERERPHRQEVFEPGTTSFLRLIGKIKKLLRKRRRGERVDEELLSRCQSERGERKRLFFQTDLGARIKRSLEQAKREFQQAVEDVQRKVDEASSAELPEVIHKSQADLEEAREELQEIARRQDEEIEDSKYRGIAEDEIQPVLTEAEKKRRAALQQKTQRFRPGRSFGRRSFEEIVSEVFAEREPQTPAEKAAAFAAAQEILTRESLRAPYGEMYLDIVRKDIAGTRLRPEEEVEAENVQQLLEKKAEAWLKDKLRSISNVGGQTRDPQHREAMAELSAFFQNEWLTFQMGDELVEIPVTPELRGLKEAWLHLHDFGEHFKTSGSPESIERVAGMLKTEYYDIILHQKDIKQIRVTQGSEAGQEMEVSLGVADFLDFYDLSRWGSKVIERRREEREGNQRELARDVIATALGLKDWQDEDVPDFEIEYTYVDAKGNLKTGDLSRLIEEFRWANNFAENLFHQTGRNAYHDFGFSGEVKDWQTKTLRFSRYLHMYGIGTPELRDVCSLDYRGFFTERKGDLLPVFNKHSSIYRGLSAREKELVERVMEKSMIDRKGWLMSRDRILELAARGYRGRRQISEKNLTSKERQVLDRLDFREELEKMGVQLARGEETTGLEGFLKYIESLSYADMHWGKGVWDERILKYYQYLNNANATRGMMMQYVRQPTLNNLIEALTKGFGYYGTGNRWKKARQIEEVRHWGLSFHLEFDRSKVKEGDTSTIQAKDNQGKPLFDEEGNIVYATRKGFLSFPWKEYGWKKVPAYEWEKELEVLLEEQLLSRKTKKELEEDFFELGIPSWEIPLGVPFIGGKRIGPAVLIGWARRKLSKVPWLNFLLSMVGLTAQKLKQEIEETVEEK